MSWSERLEEIRKNQETPILQTDKTDKTGFDSFVSEQDAHIRKFSRMPSRAELVRIAGRAVAQFPDVRVDDVVSFLADAQDPAWCSERVATHIARRIHERQLWPEQWRAQA